MSIKRGERLYFKADSSDVRAAIRERLEESAVGLERELAEAKRKIADSIGTTDLDLAARIAALGFDDETANILDLIPLVHVAWADGKIQRGERARILEILEVRGHAPESTPFQMIEALLEQPPPPAFMRQSLAILRDLLGDRPTVAQTIVSMCVDVANASGGLFGFGRRVSEQERELISKIAFELGDGAKAEFQRRLGR
jgi:tellurite resistance protein